MTVLSMAIATVLLATVALGLLRILWGPTPADRMLAAQLFGSTGVAILILLARAMNAPALLDVALVFAVLATVAAIAFVRRTWPRPQASRSAGHGH